MSCGKAELLSANGAGVDGVVCGKSETAQEGAQRIEIVG